MAKKKILLLADDLRGHTGIATMSRELVFGTLYEYDWIEMAGAVGANNPISTQQGLQHPEYGNVINLSKYADKELNLTDSYLKLYPVHNYGNETTLFTIMDIEKPDALVHFTDPRFWMWLYVLEHQIRERIPLTYLNVWDDLPYPLWNKPFYNSCDALYAISKQTYNINKWVLGPENCTTIFGDFDSEGNLIQKQ